MLCRLVPCILGGVTLCGNSGALSFGVTVTFLREKVTLCHCYKQA